MNNVYTCTTMLLCWDYKYPRMLHVGKVNMYSILYTVLPRKITFEIKLNSQL